MSEISHYKCEQCGKITHNLLYWYQLNGDLWSNDSEIRFKYTQTCHWCSQSCLIGWIKKDKQLNSQDGKLHKAKPEED